ncbi:MAG: hypothetical protein JKX97_01415 [Candidatus Lindowbacteria bacterium]|nr:hypothetical protein [Candidatus Lindowbacteria bacterium]
MKDDAANVIIYIFLAAIGMGLLVLGGHYLFTGEKYLPEYCFETNQRAGFYPYNPPKESPDEVF